MFDSWLKQKDSKLNLKDSKPIIHAVLGTPINAPPSRNEEEVYFACGCFWGAEKCFWKLPGVVSTAVGYAVEIQVIQHTLKFAQVKQAIQN